MTTKNFSFLFREGETWRLSPAYEVMHAHSRDSKWTRQHLMAVNSAGIGRAHVIEVGGRFAVPGPPTSSNRSWQS